MDKQHNLDRSASHRVSSSGSGSSFLSRLSHISQNLPLQRSRPASAEYPRAEYHLQLLFQPPEPLVDFIFVHGPRGSTQTTWSKIEDTEQLWPEWLPDNPEFRNVRMYGFGYRSDWVSKPASGLRIHDHGLHLLQEIRNCAPLYSGSTSLVFIGHSTGGIIIKRMFILAKQEVRQSDLLSRIHGMFFFATPHHGADSIQLLNNILRTYDYHDAPQLELDFESEALPSISIQNINTQFRQTYQGLDLCSFYETIETRLGVRYSKIVEKEKAVLGIPGEHTHPIGADHSNICKFVNSLDPGYLTVKSALASSLQRIFESRLSLYRDVKRSQLEVLENHLSVQDSLEDDLADSRKQAAHGTCLWLTQKTKFCNWRDGSEPSSRLFWLSGELGTGKSVIAAFVARHLDSRNEQCSYFAFQQNSAEKSKLSVMLRSFAYQMASRIARVRQTMLVTMGDNNTSFFKDNNRMIWRRMFQHKIFPLISEQRHYWIIDAFDECSDFQEFFSLFNSLEDQIPLKVFLTSRKTTKLVERFQALPSIWEEISRVDTFNDIRLFLEANVDNLPVDNRESLRDLINQVLEKSDGCFLLAGLLHQELEHTHSVQQIAQVLEAVPSEMAEYYSRILHQIAASRSKELVKAILRWTVCVMRPLTIEELSEAIRLDIQQTIPRLENMIKTTCAQLVYIDDQTKRVKLIHDSAREFFVKDELAMEFEMHRGQGHVQIAETCLKYLNGGEMRVDQQRKRSTVSQQSRSVLCDYICRYFSAHVARIPSSNEIPLKLLDTFLRTNVLSWIEYLAREKDLYRLMQAAKDFKASLSRRAKRLPLFGEEVQLLDAWAVDLVHVVAGFGSTLIGSPTSIYHLIPPLCPSSSRLHQQFSSSPRGLEVVGLSILEWDNRICCLDYRNIQSTAVACHDNRFAVGLRSGDIILYHTSTCQEAGRMDHGEQIRQICFAHVDKLLASASTTVIKLWDCDTKDNIWSISIVAEPLAMAFDEGQSSLVVAFMAGHVNSYELIDGSEVGQTPWYADDEDRHTSIRRQPHRGQISIELGLLAVVYRGRPIMLWDLKEDRLLGHCETDYEGKKVEALVFNPIAEIGLLAVSFQDGEIVTYDPWSLKRKATTEAYVQVLATSPDGKTLVAGDSSGTVHIYDFETLRLMQKISSSKTQIRSLAFASDSVRFLDTRGAQCNVWEPSILLRRHDEEDSSTEGNGGSVISPAQTLQSRSLDESQEITALASHHSVDVLFCGKRDGSVAVYDTDSGTKIHDLYRHNKFAVWNLKWNPRAHILISIDRSSKILAHKISFSSSSPRRWILKDSELRFDIPMKEPIQTLLASSDENHLLVPTSGPVHLYSLRGNDLLTTKLIHYRSSSWRWSNHAMDAALLLLLDGDTMRTFTWAELKELPSIESNQGKGPPRISDLPSRAKQSSTSVSALTKDSQGKRTSSVQLYDERVAAKDSAPSDKKLGKRPQPKDSPLGEMSSYSDTAETRTTPLRDLGIVVRPNGDITDAAVYSSLLTSQWTLPIRSVIGALGSRLIFLNYEGWVCSCKTVEVGTSQPIPTRQHFVILHDWQSNVREPVFAITNKGHVAFAKGDEIAIFKRGLEM